MFLKFIQDFGLKKIIKKRLANYKTSPLPDKIITVGIITDEDYFNKEHLIINELVKNGIKEENIETLSFKERIGPKENIAHCHFSRKDITLNGSFKKEDNKAFIYKPFDLLISFYDTKRLPLVLATMKSRAKFKAGFTSTDNRLNQFMISLSQDKYKEYIAELFKYLKILKMI